MQFPLGADTGDDMTRGAHRREETFRNPNCRARRSVTFTPRRGGSRIQRATRTQGGTASSSVMPAVPIGVSLI